MGSAGAGGRAGAGAPPVGGETGSVLGTDDAGGNRLQHGRYVELTCTLPLPVKKTNTEETARAGPASKENPLLRSLISSGFEPLTGGSSSFANQRHLKLNYDLSLFKVTTARDQVVRHDDQATLESDAQAEEAGAPVSARRQWGVPRGTVVNQLNAAKLSESGESNISDVSAEDTNGQSDGQSAELLSEQRPHLIKGEGPRKARFLSTPPSENARCTGM